ncbi:3-oxoacyl-[acyl-carrier-protein] synthase III C-terminal domain-containing protein [Actinoplanes palleronii]|uniref:3-oxoacyl-[acyl-carrier-protein] synthase 3 protein 5 n=1 Tax=Actinoplanes palleronii TaxID=113570 RepID=A0ABQ4BJ03_9ACTN|nr:3-oxoacyl-[acyl-carrier-protein] synthase III C-terminal domain-containing protein [Actinoplanes palleronii]GIE70605.1 3-oxoacyl-[acyl-carrier-protein] synthase 3 protein 5 [Actinoplanes palleronii]
MSAGITDIAVAKPREVIENDHFTSIGLTDEWIRRRSGIAARSWLPDKTPLAEVAAEACAPIVTRMPDPSSIGALIVISTSIDRRVPGLAPDVAERTCLGPGVLAFDLNAACCGFVYGLVTALSLCDAGRAGSVLVCSVEAMSRLVNRADRQTACIFADGSAAVLVENRPEFSAFRHTAGCDGTQQALMREEAGGIRLDGMQVFDRAVRRMSESARYLFDSDPAPTVVVGHQANGRILEQVRAFTADLGVPFVNRIERSGNTSSASIPLAFAEELAGGTLPTAGRLGAVAYGAGEAWGGVAVDYRITDDVIAP